MYDVGLVGFVSLGIAAWVQLDSSNERIPKPRGLVFPDATSGSIDIRENRTK
jgi:hypothetical protein